VDFVVVGLGLGALAVLLGVVMLGWMAPRAQRAAARTTSPEDAAREQAIAAQQRGTGRSFLYAGAAMLLATAGALAGSLDDRTGALLVTTTATVAAIGILLGGYLHRARNPLPRRRGLARATEPYTLPERPVSASLVRADAAPEAAETANLQVSPDANGDARFDPFPPLGPVIEVAMADDAVTEPRSTGGAAFGEAEPRQVRAVPVASPGPESESISEPADNNHADATVTEEEEGVVVGFVVPAAHPAGAASPPSRPDPGDDRS
jgi:hypothetical protein